MATPLDHIYLEPTGSKRKSVRDNSINFDPATGKFEVFDRDLFTWSLLNPEFGVVKASGLNLTNLTTDNAILRWDDATKRVVQTGVTIDASNSLTVPGTAAVSKTSGDAFTATSGNADAGFNVFTGRNINAGTLAASIVALGNDTYSVVGQLLVGSSAYSGSSGTQLADGFAVRGLRAGGLSLMADAGPIRFITGGFAASNEKARVNTAGNWGFGTSDIEAWGSNQQAFQGGSRGYIAFGKATGWATHVGDNAYHNGTAWIYRTTAAASDYYQLDGQHNFRNAASGSVDTAITWTTTMRIANGVVMIGTTTWDTTSTLQVNGDIAGATITASSSFRGPTDGYLITPNGDTTDGLYWNNTTSTIQLVTAGASRVIANQSGNVGFNTTDIEATAADRKSLQLGATAIVTYGSGFAEYGNNWYYDGSYKYRTTAAAAMYQIIGGEHIFRVAASGTIDTGVTFTKVLTIANDVSANTQISLHTIALQALDNGTGEGRRIHMSRNTNLSTPAAGSISMQDKSGTNYFVWPDDTGVLRIDTTTANVNDTGGVVVGTQTSDIRLKEKVTAFDNRVLMRDRLMSLNLHSYRFKDDSQRLDKEMLGLVVREEDRNEWWVMNTHNEKNYAALDEANLFGHIIGGFQDHEARIAELERLVAEC